MTLYQYKAVVTRVVDGDTLHCTVDLGFRTFRELTVRLAGINAPELNSKDPVVKAAAQEAKVFLIALVTGKTVWFDSKSYDKYDRSIAALYLNETDAKSVSDTMVDNGHAVYVKY